MATFTGTNADETISPALVSPTVVRDPAGSVPGAADDLLRGGGGSDSLDGGTGNDTVYGDAGNDVLRGREGDDVLAGGAGDDEILGAEGNDTADGGAGNDILAGGEGDDSLNGGSGIDMVRYTSASAGVVVDLAVTEPQHTSGAGIDTLKKIEDVTGSAYADILFGSNAANLVVGGGGGDALAGRDGDDWLDGGAGDDTLDGGAGNDTLLGGDGDDMVRYVGAAAGVTVYLALAGPQDTGGGGVDTLDSIEGITGSAFADDLHGSNAADRLLGNDGDDALFGRAGDDYLDGGSGLDTMQGGAGDDSYVVDDVGDSVVEAKNGGIDRVTATVSYSLAAEVEHLTLAGSLFFLDGTGNGKDNLIVGHGGNNVLSGQGGDDELQGGAGSDVLRGGNGDDRLDGGLSIDVMEGGLGDDTYVVDSKSDRVIENAAEGIDTVVALDTMFSEPKYGTGEYDLPDNVENLVMVLTPKRPGYEVSITGNALANRLEIDGSLRRRNASLFGAEGDDTLIGHAGHDFLDGGSGRDSLNAGDGNDTLYGSDGDDILDGGAGGDLLDGGAGADIMQGGAGDDRYRVDSGADIVVENAGAGIDSVSALVSWTLPDHVENLSLSGTEALNGTGNALVNLLYGNDAANVLRANDGDDQLFGRLGDDRLVGGNGTDSLYGQEGIDTLLGGEGNDLLDGGEGADRMEGGLGDDTFVVDAVGEILGDLGGVDLVLSKATSFDLPSGFENLTLDDYFLTNALDGTGNNLANVIVGNRQANVLSGLDGDDTLRGNGGSDQLDGGKGRDLLDGGAGLDTLTGGGGADTFLFGHFGSANVDTVADFTSGSDTIALLASVFTAVGPAGLLNPSAFHMGPAAHDSDDRILYDSPSGSLFYDSDGTGATAAIKFATLSPSLPLSAADFRIV